jgi:tetratricopeptide (TPR) repeat protein
MFNSTNVRLAICVCLTGVILLFLAGCAREQQQAVDLYVDAVMLREFDENEMAVEKLNSAVKLDNRFSFAYSLLGEIYQETEDYEKSAASYEKATELNPWSFKDYFNLGRVYQIMKEFAQAVKAYARACELKPNHLEAHVGVAQSYYEIEDYNNALVAAVRAEQIGPDVSEIQKLLGDIYESQKHYDQAIRSYKRALEIDSNNPDVMTSLAVAYLKTNCNEPAKELLISATQIRPNNNTAYQHLGYCYLLLRQQAIESHERALEIDSNTPPIETSLVEYLDKAVVNYSRAIEINDKDWEAHRGLGVAYAIRGTNNKDEALKAKAVQQWRLSLELKPNQPNRERLLKYIEIYSKQGE